MLSSAIRKAFCTKSAQKVEFEELLKDLAERRSRLFPDKVKIPARKPKLWLGAVLFINAYGAFQYYKENEFFAVNQEESAAEWRRVLPFIEAVEDIQKVNLDKRNFLLVSELFKDKGGASYAKELLYNRFSRQLVYVPNSVSESPHMGGLPRNYAPVVVATSLRLFPSTPNII